MTLTEALYILGCKNAASLDEVKKAFRKHAKKHHPDVGGNVDKFRQLNEAYQTAQEMFTPPRASPKPTVSSPSRPPPRPPPPGFAYAQKIYRIITRGPDMTYKVYIPFDSVIDWPIELYCTLYESGKKVMFRFPKDTRLPCSVTQTFGGVPINVSLEGTGKSRHDKGDIFDKDGRPIDKKEAYDDLFKK